MDAFKNGEAVHSKNEPLLFTGWPKTALETKLKKLNLWLLTQNLSGNKIHHVLAQRQEVAQNKN
jgi:hypothetical protein